MWSDHTNKFDWAWGPTRNVLESSYTLFNTRFNEVVRRTDPEQKRLLHTVGLGDFTKTNLPQVYQNKENINSIEYGVFVTEFKKNGGCYFCYAKVKVHEINLLKKIQ